MKNVHVFLSALFLILVLSACPLRKSPMSAGDFSSKLTELGFTVIDMEIDEQYAARIIHTLLAIDPFEQYKIEFIEFYSQEDAKDVFSHNNTALDQIKSGKTTSLGSLNWKFRTKTYGGVYSHISYIGTTLVFVRAPVEYRQTIRETIKELGY